MRDTARRDVVTRRHVGEEMRRRISLDRRIGGDNQFGHRVVRQLLLEGGVLYRYDKKERLLSSFQEWIKGDTA